jgi:copper resistance protein B
MNEGMHAPMGSEPAAKPAERAAPLGMGKMQGGSAPAGARDPNAYSEGYDFTSMPGLEKADKIVFGTLLLDQLEYTHSSKGDGFAWDAQAWYGNDENKLHLRSEGGLVNGAADETTSAEALWWRPLTPFWATVAGVRQDFGAGSHTHLAAGVEGIAPYWLHIQATVYLADNGGISARLKGEYDILITNRLILALELESNIYSRSNDRRGTGAGIGNIEPQVRLRYEFSRKFAPYIGFDWDRALGDTADRRRAEGESVSDSRFVAGVRMLW